MIIGASLFQRLGRYSLVGAGINAALYLVFLILVQAGQEPILISALVYIVGINVSYLLNRLWTFSSRSSHSKDIPRFLIAYTLGLGATIISMSLLVDTLGSAAAQVITIVIAALTIYGSLCLLRFGQA
jgi:putative flippase GtrA